MRVQGPDIEGRGILTADQRLRVFISSTLQELAPERRTFREAVERLHLVPVMFEAGARPHPPRTLYRAYLDQSHVFVGVYWQSYGWVTPDLEVSGLEDEYLLSQGMPSLLYIKTPAPDREPRLTGLLQRIEDEGRASYRCFESSEEFGELLADDLALLLTERFQGVGERRSSPLGSIRPRPLPVPPTPIVGREDELSSLAGSLGREDVRLITLIGPGGVGKTRLALASASELSRSFADGAFFVDLAPLSEPDEVPDAVASSIGMTYERSRLLADSVIEVLAPRSVLLLLDNFEHLTDASPFVSALLAACPDVKVLATSRIPLRLRGEHRFPVKPLALPRREPSFEEILASPAVGLFQSRAEQAEPGFSVTRENASAVVEICSRLDGLPLAIELTAPAVRSIPLGLLTERVRTSLDAFAGQADLPQRQRTLRATVDWSYSLLDERERRMLARLSVFVGGFTLEAAENVCADADEPDTLERLSSLVDNSLVAIEEDAAGRPRFRLLDTVREYARDKLHERGETEEAERRHAEYFLEFVRVAGRELRTAGQREWFLRVAADHPNIDAVLRRAIGRGDIVTGLGTTAIWIYSWITSDITPYWALLESIHAQDPPLPDDSRAWLLFVIGTGRIEKLHAPRREAVAPLTEAVELWRRSGDRTAEADAETFLALALIPDENKTASAHLDHALTIYRELGDLWGACLAHYILGEIALTEGDAVRAETMLREAVALARSIESDHMTGVTLCEMGFAAFTAGDRDPARSAFTEAAGLLLGIYSREGLADCLDGFAAVSLADGDAEDAAALLGAADATREQIGFGASLTRDSIVAEVSPRARRALGDDAFREAYARGKAMRTREAVEGALDRLARRS
ncbi:MAG: DUF4062 domain-containing protein [Coriobacteriia bacterium]|nr:DUF4062 domain-containing protein [Coriobacteriia bacterium]